MHTNHLTPAASAVSGPANIWFTRNFEGFSGGHLVHARYYRNVLRHPQWRARIIFSENQSLTHQSPATLRAERNALWPEGHTSPADIRPGPDDLLFLAGTDWALAKDWPFNARNPKLNLIQGLRHACAATPHYQFLTQRAIRICVSQAVADAIQTTGRVNGPVIVIPNGVELPPQIQPLGERSGLLIIGYKNPAFAQALSAGLHTAGIAHELLPDMIAREDFLGRVSRCATLVCLPLAEEGFYLPALEAMAQGALVITPDCGGNRDFCINKKNCLMPAYTLESVHEHILQALGLTPAARNALVSAARATAEQFSLEQEREKFYQLLKDVRQLW